MEPDFWHARWQDKQIGFHEGKANAFLVKHFSRLPVAPGSRVFVPLCGKTRDIAWLLGQGLRVAGAELSRIAVEELFAELGVAPQVSAEGALTRFSAPGLDILQGDIFALTRDALGPVDAVWDRAALVALPKDMRARYAPHLVALTEAAPQLLVCFEYDQSLVAGPPFSVPPEETRALYGDHYIVAEIDTAPVPGGLKGQYDAIEHVWLLERA
ncbi:thiopurine S-methyltransferase [Xanthobacter autotrophicus]|uniref:thiopurine S-methyltransferase n=1 Tax=Xanthobacter autotrophicus TaxID=280 RepID=UPI0024A79AA2|nr:thiopurine S-methyltransferase [Xanthobacter autotrophicus]MDI4656828.1 thiopurine S-methyltransferase [Xanthobacter autotrophicus]